MKFPIASLPKSLEDLTEPSAEFVLGRREFLQKSGFMVITAATATHVVAMMLSKFAEAGDVSTASIQELQLGLGAGKILVPASGDAYVKHATVYQARYQATRPQVLVVASSAKEISSVLKWAVKNSIPIALKSGGNCFDGFSTGPGLVIDVSEMNSIQVDDGGSTLTVGPGARLGKVYQECYNHRKVLPAGSCPQVAVNGLTQGGGHGLLSRKFGLTADHLLEAQVVTADGQILRAADDENSDLFWAIRGGGGGNFGVVTQFKFKLRDVVPVCWFSMRWTTSLGFKAFDAWQNFAPFAPDELASIMKVTASGGALYKLSMVGQFVGTESQLRIVLKPLIDQVDPGSTLSITSASSFMDAVSHFGGGLDADSTPIYFKASSDYVFEQKKLTQDGFNAMVQALGAGGVTAVAMCDAYGGAINRTPTSDTAFPHRVGAIYSIQYYTEWTSPSLNDSRVNWMNNLKAKMAPFVSGQAYVNYCDRGISNYEQAYYGSNAPRLRRVKAKVDPAILPAYPNGLFSHAQSIRPTSDDSLNVLQMIYPATSTWDGKNPVRAKCWLEGNVLVARYEVTNLQPAFRPGSPILDASTPDLYKFEVGEIFLSVNGMPTGSLSSSATVNQYGDRDEIFPYYEFEVSPRNEFLSVKVLSPKVASGDARFDASYRHPGLVHFAGMKDWGWAAELHIPLAPLGWDGDPKKIVGNLFAILGAAGNRSYWSLFLPKQAKPNFHIPRYFERLIQS